MQNVPKIFGCRVFNDKVMRERLPQEIYKAVCETIENGAPLTRAVANEVAEAMKEWAISLGATHYTHWFHPMTGATAEKHDSFIQPDGKGNVIMDFSGKELIKGEPDASGFPSGGIRATFEARGYTAWDPSSYAFVKEGSLYIPTAFCSFTGEALDKKTPLLRSMEAICKESVKMLHLLGKTDVKRVNVNAGAEQEYFLIDKEVYLKRPDLMCTGRTLFGAPPPKGQQLFDQYYGQLKPRIIKYMAELDAELWRLGINAKTKHNEVAPAQHEMAPVYTTVNVASDHNQLAMEVMKKVADKYGLVCLLHEKPFAGVNGSGKHNNWSLATDKGENLFNPGKTPQENAQFLIFLTAVIRGVNKYQELLRISVATAGNDHRLGASEAPPAILSLFLGEHLENVLSAIQAGETAEQHKKTIMDLGVTLIPKFSRDNCDRNRTSPFAFTGNKFEFRMPGSSASIAGPNTIINTIVAESLADFYEDIKDADDVVAAAMARIKKAISDHKRIIFGGNGYCEEWESQAEKRGLVNLKNTPAALSKVLLEKNIKLLERFSVYTRGELESRYEINMQNYCTTMSIEAKTMVDIVKKHIVGAAVGYQLALSALVAKKYEAGVWENKMEKELSKTVSQLSDLMYERLLSLEKAIDGAESVQEMQERGDYYGDKVMPAMQSLREMVDKLESIIPSDYWTLPTYSEMLFSVI